MIEFINLNPARLVEFISSHRDASSYSRWHALRHWISHRALICTDSRERWIKDLDEAAQNKDVDLSDVPMSDGWTFCSGAPYPQEPEELDPFKWEDSVGRWHVRAVSGPDVKMMIGEIAKNSGQIRVIDRYAGSSPGNGIHAFMQSVCVSESLGEIEVKCAHSIGHGGDIRVTIDEVTCLFEDATKSAISRGLPGRPVLRPIPLPDQQFMKDGHDRFVAGYRSEYPDRPQWALLLGTGLRALTFGGSRRPIVAVVDPEIFDRFWTILDGVDGDGRTEGYR